MRTVSKSKSYLFGYNWAVPLTLYIALCLTTLQAPAIGTQSGRPKTDEVRGHDIQRYPLRGCFLGEVPDQTYCIRYGADMGRALSGEALGVLGHVDLPLSGHALHGVVLLQGLRKKQVDMQLSTDALLYEEEYWRWSGVNSWIPGPPKYPNWPTLFLRSIARRVILGDPARVTGVLCGKRTHAWGVYRTRRNTVMRPYQ